MVGRLSNKATEHAICSDDTTTVLCAQQDAYTSEDQEYTPQYHNVTTNITVHFLATQNQYVSEAKTGDASNDLMRFAIS